MNKFFLILFLTGVSRLAIAQSDSVTFDITIANSKAIKAFSISGVPVFYNSSLNTILSAYTITEFASVSPTSRMEYLRDIYTVRCNSFALAEALHNADSVLFPSYYRTYPPMLAYTPNDMYIHPNGSAYLKYIMAEQAWTITRGDSNVVIGVLDEFFRTDHPDFFRTSGSSKINRVGPNAFDSGHHGTAVASIIGGATDNGIGLPSLGFNCQLDLSTDWRTERMMEMSDRGVRIINCSWLESVAPTLNLRNHFDNQGRYNDIYENGTLMVCAAGNGKAQDIAPPFNADWYCFPASYDHVLSVSSVCWKEDNRSAYQNVKGNHAFRMSDPLNTFNHNTRVDICAPAYEIGAFDRDLKDPSKLYYFEAFGTSVACPMVAATAGLVQSALKMRTGAKDANYSPYQLEWILKATADTTMLSLVENAPFTGRLGAGSLNAWRAAAFARFVDSSNFINAPVAQTMYIKGIEINTICAPGKASNGVLPKLKPIIINGTPPYQYVWEKVPGKNNATLDNENIAEPTVTAMDSPYVLWYRLTVYDNSPIAQKVAMKTFRVNMRTSGFDLAVRDSYMDMLDEKNTEEDFDKREWDIWTSPDVWNRQHADYGLENQNPEYFTTASNYMYARVRNVGCAPSPATNYKLRLYWSKASTGENWATDWTTTDICGIGSLKPGGREVTPPAGIPIPVMQPGEEHIYQQDWHPEKPEEYCGAPSSFDVCLLARIEGPHKFYGGEWHSFDMTIPELYGINVSKNVRNNNNIVTRNTILTNLNPDNTPTMKRQLIIANGNTTATVYNFEFASERSIFRHFGGDFSSLGSVTLHLGNLYDVWTNAGGVGTYASLDPQAKTVTFDGANTLRLEGISLAANERHTIEVEFKLDSGVVVSDTSTHIFHARQFEANNPDDVYGAVNYILTVNPSSISGFLRTTSISDNSSGNGNNSFEISPNPTKSIVHILSKADVEADVRVTDLSGKQIIIHKMSFASGVPNEVNLGGLPTGVYLIHIHNKDGKIEMYKIIKN